MNDTLEEEGRFMVAVGAVIEHVESGKILLLKRAGTADYLPGIWEDPMGRLKQHEEPEEALEREIREECGLEIEIFKPIAVFHDYRGERTPENEWIGITYWCRAKSNQVTLSNEHSEYQWVLPQVALELVEHPGVRKDIEALIRENG